MREQNHPVVKELERIKQYFGKIQEAESPTQQRNLTLDKQAAARMIQHSLVLPSHASGQRG